MNKREIKFRAWDDANKRFLDPLSAIHFSPDGNHLLVEKRPGRETWSPLNGNSGFPKWMHLQQFTGVYDKTGKEIYEGDIVETYGHRFEVHFDGGRFEFKDSSGAFGMGENCEVIGNIYDNPELVK